MTIDAIASKAEKLVLKINDLNFKFSNPQLQEEADEIKSELETFIESYIDLCQSDLDLREEKEHSSSEGDTE